VYHLLLRKLVNLATMESSREDMEAFIQFWSLLNEVCPYIAVFLYKMFRQMRILDILRTPIES